LQEQHTVAGNSDKERPAFVDNFGTGPTELAPGVGGNHTVAELHTEPRDQAALGKKVGIGTHLASEDQFESGAQPGTENWVELEKRPPFECLVEQAQKDGDWATWPEGCPG